jgi:hypothetical protein
MTSQRDETVSHISGDEMADDPIVVERHDEILGGPPVDDPDADDAFARDAAADDSTPADDELATGRPAGDELAGDEPASDELAGRHAAPETDSAGLEQDPPPLVAPSDSAPGDPAAPSGAVTSDAEATVPETETPVAADAGPLDASPVETSPVDASTVDASPAGAGTAGAGTAASTPVGAGTPAASASEPASANGDGVPAAALAGQQWPEIQAMFVDDPKGSVERAAAAADEVAKAFVASLQREQTALRAAWENDTTTEDLRTALQQYRAFCGRLEGLA